MITATAQNLPANAPCGWFRCWALGLQFGPKPAFDDKSAGTACSIRSGKGTPAVPYKQGLGTRWHAQDSIKRFTATLALNCLLPVTLLSPALAQQTTSETTPLEVAVGDLKAESPKSTGSDFLASLRRDIKGQRLLDDLDQFRQLLKYEWMLSNLNGADFDAATDLIAQDAQVGMTIAQLAFRLQRVLAMGGDGHAGIGQFRGALQTVEGVRPDFLIDMSGDGYTTYRVEREESYTCVVAIIFIALPINDSFAIVREAGC